MSDIELESPRPEVAILRLNRPESLNALSWPLVEALHETLDRIDRDNACRVVILTGAGRGFCAGVDLEHLKQHREGRNASEGRAPRLGEEEFLKSRSPLFASDNIRAPLLIVQGKNDPRVNRDESLQIVAAMEKAGQQMEFLEFEDEGHGFAKPENRLIFYAKAERFLAEHLGGRLEE